MKDQLTGVDSLWRITLKQAVPFLSCKTKKQMERAKNGTRYFRNPPQPHMCIQDSIQGTNETCYINVLSWTKISTPRRPEDPIPLYGGMRIPCSNTTVMSFTAEKKQQLSIFAVMANPEILRLSGKMAKDPTDRDALVDLMLDFVEAMNSDLKFNREFSVLKDRDLTGELKDIWMAIQLKREKEKEKPENGRKYEMLDRDKMKTETEKYPVVGFDDKELSQNGLLLYQQRSNEEEHVDKIKLLNASKKTENLTEVSQFSKDIAHGPSCIQKGDGAYLVKCSKEIEQKEELKQPSGPSEREAGDASPTRRRRVKVKQQNKLLAYSREEAGKQPCSTIIKQAVFQEMPLSSSDSSEDEERAANEGNTKSITIETKGVSLQCKNMESQLLLGEKDKHKTNGVREGYFASVFHDQESVNINDHVENETDKSKPFQSINANVFTLSNHLPTSDAKDQPSLQNFAVQIGRNSTFVMHDCKIVALRSPRN